MVGAAHVILPPLSASVPRLPTVVMDQIQTQDQLDSEVAQEVIALLNRKVANLRSENAELQVWLSPTPIVS